MKRDEGEMGIYIYICLFLARLQLEKYFLFLSLCLFLFLLKNCFLDKFRYLKFRSKLLFIYIYLEIICLTF